MSLACSTCPVRDRAACSVLEEVEREELAKAGRTHKLAKGETLFAAGMSAASCATLLSGALKITSTDADGRERILSLVHPSGFAWAIASFVYSPVPPSPMRSSATRN